MTNPTDLLSKALVLEGHRDCYEQIHHTNAGHRDPVNDHVVPRLRAGYVDIVVYAVGGDSIAHSNGRDKRLLATLDNISVLKRAVRNAPDSIRIAVSSDDLPDRPDGIVHFVLHLEGGGPLEGSLGALEALFDLGVRSMQPAWNLRNELADGVRETDTDGGLTRFGVDVLAHMEEWGMLIDLAHIAPAGFWHALRVTTRPLVVSHSNARAVYDHSRNLTDDQMRAVAERDGVIGIHALPAFVDENTPTVDRLVDHVAHMVEVAGIEHVGFGGDFIRNDGPRSGREQIPPRIVEELEDFGEIDDLPNLVDSLARRGFADSEIEMLLATNFTRVLRRAMPATGTREVTDAD
jgi:membrane dipeptidase